MSIIFFRFFFLILFGLIAPSSFAKVSYISLHDQQSTDDSPLELTLNIVEIAPDVALRFVLVSNGTEKLLRAKRVNQYIVKLKDSEPLFAEGAIDVYESEGQSWDKIKTIKLPKYQVAQNSVKREIKKQESISSVSKRIELANSPLKVINTVSPYPITVVDNCQLERDDKETLWSIASRYKLAWNTNVYGAMVAIYRENRSKFIANNIENLMDYSTLNCPREKILTSLNNPTKMKAIFKQIIAKPETDNTYNEQEKNSIETCELERQANETLWSLASRYKSEWNTSIYGAMIAIYYENKANMVKGNIDNIIALNRLNCPNELTLKSLGNKAEMKAEFIRLR